MSFSYTLQVLEGATLCTDAELDSKFDWNIKTFDDDLRTSIRNSNYPISFDLDSLLLTIETEEESYIGKTFELTLQIYFKIGEFIA